VKNLGHVYVCNAGLLKLALKPTPWRVSMMGAGTGEATLSHRVSVPSGQI
jgi:hypothetical protein